MSSAETTADSTKESKTLASICIYCGSSPGISPTFAQKAAELGQEMARRNIRLVYGGGNIGLMGAVSSACEKAGGKVIGVIPDALRPREISGEVDDTRETIPVPDMHTRKATMADLSEAFIALPGGFGTFEELFEVITWQQLGIHRKPIGILNVEGFYDDFLKLIQNASKSGFIRPEFLDIVVCRTEPIELLDALERHEPPSGLTTWLKKSQI